MFNTSSQELLWGGEPSFYVVRSSCNVNQHSYIGRNQSMKRHSRSQKWAFQPHCLSLKDNPQYPALTGNLTISQGRIS